MAFYHSLQMDLPKCLPPHGSPSPEAGRTFLPFIVSSPSPIIILVSFSSKWQEGMPRKSLPEREAEEDNMQIVIIALYSQAIM